MPLPSDPSPDPHADDDASGAAPTAGGPTVIPADPTLLLPDEIAATLPIARPEPASPE